MNLIERLKADLALALRVGHEPEVQTLRLLLSAVHNKEIQKKGEKKSAEGLNDEEVINLIRSEEKKRKESITAFSAGKRMDLVKKESEELVYVSRYLPALMNREELEKYIKKSIPSLKSQEFGPAMKHIMASLQGKADAGLVSQIVKKELGL